MKRLKILVVNGFSSGKMIVEEAKRLGYECFHLSTAMEGVPEAYMKHNMAKGYDGILELKERFEDQVDLCRDFHFDIVMPGTESGVILAEKLANALSLPCNDINLVMARRDKYYMQKRLEEQGVCCIKSQLVHTSREAIDWYRTNAMEKVVMKPRMDAGGIGFHICETEAEIEKAFESLYGQRSCFGENIESPDVLIQEYVTGEEIIVNHVSHNGMHELTDIWTYDKEGAVYSYKEMINVMTAEYSDAVRYTQKALDALGITVGPSHSEIMLTEKGPLLIETGARPMGTMLPCDTTKKVFGHSIMEKIIHSYVYPVQSDSIPVEGCRLSDLKCFVYHIRSYVEGRITGIPVEDILENCPYVTDIRLDILKDTMTVEKTIDLVTSPGSFALIDENEKALREWIELFRIAECKHPHLMFAFENDPPLTEEERELKKRLQL